MIYPKNIPYLRTLDRHVILERGTPAGKGNLVFFLTENQDITKSLIVNRENFTSNYMHFYFYPARYRGKLGVSRYNLNLLQARNAIYKRIGEETKLKPYPKSLIIRENEKFSTYYDLSMYWKLYKTYTEKLQASKRITLFWDLFLPILKESYGELTNKSILLDANEFALVMGGNAKKRLNNPLYILYFTLFRYPDLIKDLDLDFLLYCHNRVLKVNPSKISDAKEDARNLLIQLRKLYKCADKDLPSGEDIVNEEGDTVPEEGAKDNKENTKENEQEKEAQQKSVDAIATKKVQAVKVAKNTPTVDKLSGTLAAPQPKLVVKTEAKDITVGESSVKKLKKNAEDLRKTNPELAEKLEKHISSAEAAAKKAIEDDREDEDEGTPTEADEISDELVEETLDEEQETLNEIYEEMVKDTSPKPNRSTERDRMLKEKQEDIVVKGMTVKELSKINPKEREIKKNDVSKVIQTSNPNMKEIKFQNFNESYEKEVLPKDIVGVFEELNNKSIKMFIRDIKVEDSSDVLNYKETWTVLLEDENRTRHTIKFDIPKFYDKNFLWLGGNKKTIKNQLFFLPVVKISNDTVMLVTNYNKMSIKRMAPKTLREVMLMGKLIESDPTVEACFVKGSSSVENREYLTGLEYDEYAKEYLEFKNGKVHLYFSQKTARSIQEAKNIKPVDGAFFIGFEGNEPLFVNSETQKIMDRDPSIMISELINSTFTKEQQNAIHTFGRNIPKRLIYTKVTTMKQDVPMMILMCLWEGLSVVMKKAGIKFRLGDNLRDLKYSEDFIQFKNCYLIFESSVPTELLMNGLKFLNTKDFDISELDEMNTYIPYIQKKYGKISILNALNNVYEFTIGNIEKEILKDMKLPTDLISLMIYANNLLADNECIPEIDMNQYRIRCAEIIPAIVYDTIAKAYVPYKNSNGKKKLSIPQDAVIKKLLALQTVEDYSSLNPFLELETTHGASTKGWRGVNLEQSYTVPKRSYDKSMTGIIGVSSSPDGQVGVNRTLTMEPSINSVRGYVEVKDDKLDELKDVNLFSPAEMLIPLGATRDDPIRTGHSVKQSRASVPVKGGSPVLISNGSDELCKYYLSSDFVVNAEQDGKVVEYDEVAKIMIIEYKDGSHKAINLDKNLVKNGGGGFELSNVLITDLKVGDTFKANETLAWHKNFFKKIPTQGVRMNVGALIKIALYSSYGTYEDANFITEKVSNKCETEMCFRVKCVLGKNSNVFRMVKVGDEILVGDSLIDFDESFDESDINELLASLGDEELKNTITENTRNQKKSKYSGVIEEIKIFSGSDLEELSPSLQKIVGDYYKRIDRKKKVLNKYDKSDSIVKCGLMVTESTGKTEPNRYGNIRGEKVEDGVLIEFYVKHSEPLEVGSKVANFSPLKNVVGEVIPNGYEPFSELHPGESVDSIISPSSILNRMVSSVVPTIFGNKCIIELKRKLEDIWTGNGEFDVKRKKMESLIYKFFSTIDKTGDNTKKYKAMFQPMSDNQFKSFFKEFFSNEDHYLILEIVDYERNVEIEDIQEAAKVLGIPLFEYVTFPHLNMDKEHPIVTKHPIPVGYLHLKRPQQTIMKKNGMSTAIDERSAITNQVMGADKNGRESDLENSMLVSLGMEKVLKELNGPRADDAVAKQEMLQAISTQGYVRLEDLTDDIANKTTLNTIDTYFLGMSLKTDLVSKTLKLPFEVDKE